MNADLLNYFQDIEDNYNYALENKNLDELNSMLSDEWTYKEKSIGELTKTDWLNILKDGQLRYSLSKKLVTNVKLYNRMAIVTSKGNVSGNYNGEKFTKGQSVINTYRRIKDSWFMITSKESDSYSETPEKLGFHNWVKYFKNA